MAFDIELSRTVLIVEGSDTAIVLFRSESTESVAGQPRHFHSQEQSGISGK